MTVSSQKVQGAAEVARKDSVPSRAESGFSSVQIENTCAHAHTLKNLIKSCTNSCAYQPNIRDSHMYEVKWRRKQRPRSWTPG